MANRIYKTPTVDKSTGTIYTRETTSITPDGEVLITAWSDDAWNRALDANRRYLADLEWQRNHPYLAWIRNAGYNTLDAIGNFVNDEILLNKGNIRVKNAQNHPLGLDWFRQGGNQAVGLLAAGTAPMWLPELAGALPALSGAGEGSLMSTVVPQVASRTAPNMANLLNWGVGGTGTILLGRALSNNGGYTPSFSFPSSYSGSYMADAAPTDSVGTTPTNPAPADTTGTANPSIAPTTGTGAATGASPEPERNDSTSLRRPSFRERLGDRIAGRNRQTTSSGNATPPNNDNQNGSFLGRMLWETKNNNFGLNWWQWRNVGRVGLYLSYPAREYIWPAVGKTAKYMVVGPDSIPPSTTPGPQTAAPADTLPGVSNLSLPDSTVINANSDWEEWLRSRQAE